jgi:hypothetical protein
VKLNHTYISIATGLILAFASYQFAFKNTIVAWQINHQLKDSLNRFANITYQPDFLKRKNENLNQLLNKYKADTVTLRNNIINSIAIVADKMNVKLAGVPVEDKDFHTNYFIVEKLDFEGSYFDLCKMVNALQTTPNIGYIRSASWKVTKKRTADAEQKKLTLEIYLEVIK